MQKLLIVDDSFIVRQRLQSIIKDQFLDLSVYTVADGLSAIQVAQQEEPNIILLDMMLLGLDGLSVIHTISGLNLDVHIMMVTALRRHHPSVKAGFDAGAKSFFSKSDKISNLVRLLTQHINNVSSSGV